MSQQLIKLLLPILLLLLNACCQNQNGANFNPTITPVTESNPSSTPLPVNTETPLDKTPLDKTPLGETSLGETSPTTPTAVDTPSLPSATLTPTLTLTPAPVVIPSVTSSPLSPRTPTPPHPYTPTPLPTLAPLATATSPPPSLPSAHTAQLTCSDPVVTPLASTGGGPIALRSDIQLRQVIMTIGTFIRLDLDPLTHDIFYMDSWANIYRLHLQPGTASESSLIYSFEDIGGGHYTLGMAFGPDGSLYVVGNENQSDTTRAIIRKGVPNQTGQRVWSTLASTDFYPKSNTAFDHVFSAIAVSPDGQYVYVNSGSRTDHGEVQSNNGTFPDARELPLTAAIFRLPTQATDLLLVNDEAELKAQGYLFAAGIRNAFDMDFAPNGELFASENGPDFDYPEELNWIREGHHYGFPWRMGNYDNRQQFPDYNPTQDPWIIENSIAALKGTFHNDPTFPSPPSGVTFTPPIANFGPAGDHFRDMMGCEHKASQLGLSMGTFTPHRSPLGLTFDTQQTLSEEFRGDAFLLSFGPAYEAALTDRGQDLLHLDLTQIGSTYQVRTTQLVRDFASPIDSLLLNNKLYVLELGRQDSKDQIVGTIWEVTLP